jgi:inorganic pyrophosphatase
MKSKSELPPFDVEKEILTVLVESPKGCRNKYAYDPESGFLTLKKVLPYGMVFPFDFGSIPGTQCKDGDTLDVLEPV